MPTYDSGRASDLGGLNIEERRADSLNGIRFDSSRSTPTSANDTMLFRQNSDIYWWDGSSATNLTTAAGGGGGGGTLDGAYDNGSTITVNNGAVVLAGVDEDTNVLSITGDGDSAGALLSFSHTTTSRNDILGSGSNWAVTGAGAATFTQIDLADNEVIQLGTGDDATIAWNGTLLNIAGATDFDNNVTMQGTLVAAGSAGADSLTLTAGDAVLSDGSLAITDADNANTLTITNNTHSTGSATTGGVVEIQSTSLTTGTLLNLELTEGTLNGGEYLRAYDVTAGADVFNLGENGAVTIAGAGASTVLTITAGDASILDGSLALTDADNAESVTIINNTATTIGAAASAGVVQIESTSLTTGAALNVQLTEGTLNGGWYYSAWDATGASRVWSVGENGLTTISGSASGTDALVLTAGDILVTAGHVDMTVGDLTLADGSASITDADNAASLTVTNNTVTTANALVDVASTSITTGAMARINANTATHDGEILELISAGDATSTPTGLSVTIASPTTGAATGIDVVMAGATTGPKGISVTMDAITESDMLYLDNGGATLTTGFFINCNDDDTGLFTVGANGITTIAGTAGSASLTVTAGDVVFSDGSISLTDADNAETVTIINNTATTIGAGASAGVVQLESTSLTTGNLLNLELTEGTLNGGSYIGAWDATGAEEVFSVSEDGATVIKGAAALTAALTLTTGDLVMSDGVLNLGTDAGVTADVGSAQGNGPITNSLVQVSTVGTTGDAQTLPVASAGKTVIVTNQGANAMDLFPASGDDINETGANTAVSVAVNETVLCVAYDSTNWEVLTLART